MVLDRTGSALGDDMTLLTSEAFTRWGAFDYITTDGPIGDSIREFGEWAQCEISFLISLINAGDTVVDVGANIGFHAVSFAAAVGSSGQVIAVEAHPQVFEVLARNIRRLSDSNVRALNVAAGLRPTSVSKSVVVMSRIDPKIRQNVGAQSFSLAQPGAQTSQVEGIEVELVSLDELELSACNLIKIDVEGKESEVIAGLRNTIDRLRPFVFFECSDSAQFQSVLDQSEWNTWRFFLVRSAAFNRDNIRSNPLNFFGDARESAVLFAPNEHHIQEILSAHLDVVEFETSSQLHDLLLSTQRFGAPSVLEVNPIAAIERIRMLELEVSDLRWREQVRSGETVVDPSGGAAVWSVTTTELQDVHAAYQMSTSWRVTRPLRYFSRLLKRFSS